MKAKLVKESLNESSTSNHFMIHYGQEIKDCINKLKELHMKVDKGEIEESTVMKAFEKIENIYDEPAINYIDNAVMGGGYDAFSTDALVDAAMRIYDRFGTEPQMLLDAIDRFYSYATRK